MRIFIALVCIFQLGLLSLHIVEDSISIRCVNGVPPPPVGTWNVTEPTIVENEILTINGSINVFSSLTIRNSVIRLNYSAGARFLHVHPEASLILINSTIKPIDGSGSMLINVSRRAELMIQNSAIKSLDTAIYFNIYIYSNDIDILNSQIDMGKRGDIYFYGSNLDIINTFISSRYLYFRNDSAINIEVYNTTIDLRYNFYIYSHNVTVNISRVSAESVCVYGSNFIVYKSEIMSSSFYIKADSINDSLISTLFNGRLTVYGENVTIMNCTIERHARMDSVSAGIIIKNSVFKEDLELGGDFIKVFNSIIGSPENEFYPVIDIWGSHIILENNRIYAKGKAIYASISGDYIKIQENLIYGYCEFSGDNIEVFNNTIIGTQEYRGFEILNGYYLTFRHNYIYNGSFIVYVSSLSTLGTYTIENNYVNDLPVYFWVSETVKTIKEKKIGSLILIQCRNITLENLVIYGLTIISGGNFTIRNIITKRSYYGIYLGGAGLENIEIWNASIVRNYYGVYIKYVDNLTILNSTIAFNAYDGIGGINAHAVNVYIHNSSIMSNIGFGIKISVYYGGDLNATYNWWGSKLGPEYKATSDPFDPEEVHEYSDVIVEPYLTYPATVIDSSPPLINIISPTPDSVLKNSTVKIVVNASDDSGVDYVEIYGDGRLLAKFFEPPFEIVWNTTDGLHEVVVYVYDVYGNVNSSSIKFTIDTKPPSVEILYPSENEYLSGITLISIRAWDAVAIDIVEIYIDDQKVAEFTNEPYEYEWNTTKFSDGEHVIKAKAIDYAGLVGEAEIRVYVDNTAPIIGSIEIILGKYINKTLVSDVKIKVNTTDELSGIAKVILQYRFSNTIEWKNTTMVYRDGAWEATIPNVPVNEILYVKIIAVDKAGNIAVKQKSFEIPTQEAPQMGINLYLVLWIGAIVLLIFVLVFIAMRYLKRR